MQTCPNCSYENRPGVVFCENCGTSLIGSSAGIETRAIEESELYDGPAEAVAARVSDSIPTHATPAPVLEGAEPAESGTSEFPEEGLLRLEVSETTNPIIMMVEKSVTFGRLDATTGSMPDIDLTPFAGYRAGVSRRHAEIRLDKDTQKLNIWDLGSSNGTFLNGDRLISHRPYTISDGDSIRFGQLDVTVRFERKVEDSKAKAKSPKDASAKD
jgi:pSer/pThr/pTyr-binding forkhead associated (FHA) protein